ncbi:DUF2790 domain-containing protein [Pseudomonas sp. BMS12]|uniref:DUF2790 domain-containing protein n=1 Tax=Pseudomonas sp. BMS12 TaxID=1796033 RepID=UPI00083B0B07|nr:DUF2790 domain-containing protein [Pseudomonas sp. BMS12]
MQALAVLALASLSSLAFAAPAADSQALRCDIVQYQYGMDLDVARVISTSDVSSICGVPRAVMVYEDHDGRRHRLSYLTSGGGCSDN